MPYPNEHSARVEDPAGFQPDSFRRKEIAPGVTVIIGRKKGERTTTVQAYRFDRHRFTAEQARAWLKKHGVERARFEPASPAKAACPEYLDADVWLAANVESDRPAAERPRRFRMQAYGGGIAHTAQGPMVFRVAGIRVPSGRMPVLQQHDPARICGHADSVEAADGRVRLEGVVTERTEAGREVGALLDDGFPWQASVRLRIVEARWVGDGEEREENGRRLSGPFSLVTSSVLREASFVPLGADEDTYAVAATAGTARVPVRGAMEEEEEMSEETERARPATLEELEAAFGGDPAFVLAQLRAGATLAEARLAFGEEEKKKLEEEKKKLEERVAALEKELAEAKAAADPANRPSGFVPGDASGEDAVARWREAVERHVRVGLGRREAVMAVEREDPRLREAMLAAVNGR